MSISLNRVILAGNLTRDPTTRFLANEQAVANFGLAVNRRYKGSDGQMKEEVTFVDIEAWGRTAELVSQYLTKGRGAFIEGRLKLDSWTDKDGKPRTRLKVVADNVQFTDSKPKDGAAPATQAGAPAQASPAADPTQAGSPARTSAPAPADDEPPF